MTLVVFMLLAVAVSNLTLYIARGRNAALALGMIGLIASVYGIQ